MADPFTTPAKQGGTCVVCGASFPQGTQLHMQNIGTEANKIWLVSPHEECFKKIQEKPELMKQAKKGGGGRPQRNDEQRFQDSVKMLDLLWPVAVTKATKELPITTGSLSNEDSNLRDRRILQAVFLKALTEEYTR